MSNTDIVIQREASRLRAIVEGRVDELTDLLHDQLIYVHSNGAIDSKKSYLEGFGRSVVITGIEVKERQLAELADEVIVTQRLLVGIRAAASNETIEKAMVASSVWHKTGGGWLLVLMHSTIA